MKFGPGLWPLNEHPCPGTSFPMVPDSYSTQWPASQKEEKRRKKKEMSYHFASHQCGQTLDPLQPWLHSWWKYCFQEGSSCSINMPGQRHKRRKGNAEGNFRKRGQRRSVNATFFFFLWPLRDLLGFAAFPQQHAHPMLISVDALLQYLRITKSALCAPARKRWHQRDGIDPTASGAIMELLPCSRRTVMQYSFFLFSFLFFFLFFIYLILSFFPLLRA